MFFEALKTQREPTFCRSFWMPINWTKFDSTTLQPLRSKPASFLSRFFPILSKSIYIYFTYTKISPNFVTGVFPHKLWGFSKTGTLWEWFPPAMTGFPMRPGRCAAPGWLQPGWPAAAASCGRRPECNQRGGSGVKSTGFLMQTKTGRVSQIVHFCAF